MSSFADGEAEAYDGVARAALATRLGVARLALYARVGSTMDVAHALAAAGACDATLVLADAQTGGRGRGGRRWASPPGTGVWATWIARPERADALDVLSLRVGLALAEQLDALAPAPVRIKWPNDLLLAGPAPGKVAGILVEARWREARPEWVAIGVGINVRPPNDAALPAAWLGAHVSRVDVAEALTRALRAASRAAGPLGADELHAYAARDAILGRQVVAPVAGTVAGLLPTGEVLVRRADGVEVALRQATLTYADEPLPD